MSKEGLHQDGWGYKDTRFKLNDNGQIELAGTRWSSVAFVPVPLRPEGAVRSSSRISARPGGWVPI